MPKPKQQLEKKSKKDNKKSSNKRALNVEPEVNIIAEIDADGLSMELPPLSSAEAPSSSGFKLDPAAVSRGFIPRIRMTHISKNKSISYVLYNQNTGDVISATPVGEKSKVKKATFSSTQLLSPNSNMPVSIGKITATTPQGKTQLVTDGVMGTVITPGGNTEYKVIRLIDIENRSLFLEGHNFEEMDSLKSAFKLEQSDLDLLRLNSDENSELPAPEFRGGTVLLTANDIKYRTSKNKVSGGHRSLFPQPTQVMNKQSAKDLARKLGFYSREFGDWDWGHLLPAGGSPQGLEVNLDPYNFVAVPATLNTWQMVPEMIARHLAQLDFKVEYTALARTEKTPTGEFSFVAKEIYSSVKFKDHGIVAEFFTTREDHNKPYLTDAVHVLSEFYKVAGRPIPKDLNEKFERELNAKLAEMKQTLPAEGFMTPVAQIVTAKRFAFLENKAGMDQSSPYSFGGSRPGYTPLARRGAPKIPKPFVLPEKQELKREVDKTTDKKVETSLAKKPRH